MAGSLRSCLSASDWYQRPEVFYEGLARRLSEFLGGTCHLRLSGTATAFVMQFVTKWIN